jgi:hypothetical protein
MKKKSLVLLFIVGCIFSGKAQQIGNGYASYISDFNTRPTSGLYQTDVLQVGFPETNPNYWSHLFVIRHSNPNNNFQMQLASSYKENDRLYFRKIEELDSKDKNSSWYELATRGKNHFTGDQILEVGKSYWIGNAGDAGNRLRLHHNGSSAYIDFFPRLYFRYGTTQLATMQENLFWITAALWAQGGIKATNIDTDKITIAIQTWPDYVFDTSYHLPNLKEVATHIQKHKHLPGIPSESEVKESGINLGEMQVKLLQKIEELTLYVIQQNEEIQSLKDKLTRLETNK